MLHLCYFLFVLLISLLEENVLCCNEIERRSLLSFANSTRHLNWSLSTDCCRWEGVSCTLNHRRNARVTGLSLPGKSLSGTLDVPFLANLSYLSHLNLSHNHLTGPLPFSAFQSLSRLQMLDLSFNQFSGGLLQPPARSLLLSVSIRFLDLSSNRLNGSLDHAFFRHLPNLITFNVSNNTFTGQIPCSFICSSCPSLEVLDLSNNQFNGSVLPGLGECSKLKIFKAAFNSLSGLLPNDLYEVKTLQQISLSNNLFSGPINDSIVHLPKLTILELQVNELTGEMPIGIGLLSNLEQLQLHTNSLEGPLPQSLTDCSSLKTLLLRNNNFSGEISILDFSKLQRLQAVDLGNNSFVGEIPSSFCLCRSITALRLAYNMLTGEIPPCMASLTSLTHFSVSNNYLSNVAGALKILRHCDELAVLFMSRCFRDETMPDDDGYDDFSFQNLQILTLGGCQLKGRIPFWISKLRRLKILNLSYNRISGPIPTWLGSMPSLFVLNLTQNELSGQLPREITRLPALISDNTSSDLSYLALPFLFDAHQYNRLFNLPRALKVNINNLSGSIPGELGRLRLIRVLELGENNFNGRIPEQLSNLVNLEMLDMSGNNLTGEIPQSLTGLSFLSSFSVANNDLQGEIPRGGQFDTFPAASFEGNPKLCGFVIRKRCDDNGGVLQAEADEEDDESQWYIDNLPFGLGYLVGLFAVMVAMFWRSVRG
ncbi:Receptor-like protein 2 [Striga hermonthica]|uniref:Receptor-like protein 2 n=1 Tax=Striga hermonthica TaxID=68872 RepID=A0A9N7N3Q5_STRHE|nr:Receptor-like protein 2 [Striga hermonthica]